MKSLWNEQDAQGYEGDLGQRVYSSRLLGQEPSLVLHGGGNTSVKLWVTNVVGEEEEILYVKGSGWDLATIEAQGFAPVRLAPLLKLAQLPALSDSQMVNELKTQVTRAQAPTPSVETILHALLPYKYVDHTHADAVVTLTNTEKGLEHIQRVYGDRLVIIPYVMPGFDLARVCAQSFAQQAREATVGMVLMNHGIFSFGATARHSYESMIELVSLAEDYLKARQVWNLPYSPPVWPVKPLNSVLAQLRADLCRVAGFPVILQQNLNERNLAFSQRHDLAVISQQGPATPDHVIRTKRLPQIGCDVDAYARAYEKYFQEQVSLLDTVKTPLDPAPRVILDPELGICTVGKTVQEARIAADIYQHTLDIIEWATALGGYQALAAADIFAVEYWELEQAKLKLLGKAPPLSGQITLITGAASGIGRACVEAFLQQGAAVVGLDIQPQIEQLYPQRPDFLGLTCDLTDPQAVAEALTATIAAFGGVDMLILNAGIFPPSCALADLHLDDWERVLAINLDANLTLMRECYPYLKLAPQGGRVVAIGSKNVSAPGPGAAAYSVSKAALNQLMRVAALEWGQQGIRLNSLHPNGVFDTGIWSAEILSSRAQHYGLTVDEYRSNNILQVEVTSQDVAQLAVALCSPLFSKTTGAQIPIDGGNERVI